MVSYFLKVFNLFLSLVIWMLELSQLWPQGKYPIIYWSNYFLFGIAYSRLILILPQGWNQTFSKDFWFPSEEMVFKTKIWVLDVVIATWVSLLLNFCEQGTHDCVCTYIHKCIHAYLYSNIQIHIDISHDPIEMPLIPIYLYRVPTAFPILLLYVLYSTGNVCLPNSCIQKDTLWEHPNLGILPGRDNFSMENPLFHEGAFSRQYWMTGSLAYVKARNHTIRTVL